MSSNQSGEDALPSPQALPLNYVLPGRLSQKGVFIVGLPVLVQLTFLVVILSENARIDAEAVREAHYKRLLSCATDLSVVGLDVFAPFNMYFVHRRKQDLQRIQPALVEMDLKLAKLREEAGDDAATKEACDLMITTAQESRSMFAKGLTLLSGEVSIDSACELYEMRKRMGKVLFNFIKAHQKLISVTGTLTVSSSRRLIRNRAIERDWLLAAAASSAVLAVALGSLFAREIRLRLGIIKDNTGRLERDQALKAPVGGNDEIQELDQSFRNMAAALKAAQEKEKLLLEERRQFYAMIAHDIRSPLMSVKSSLHLTIDTDGEQLSETSKKSLQRADRSLESMTRLIGDLLDVEKLNAGKFEIHALKTTSQEIVESALSSTQGLIDEKHLQLSENIDQIEIFGDRELLSRVLANLLSNAIKFSPDGAALAVATKSDRKSIRFSVSDHGPGIAEAEQQRVFERFTQSVSAAQSKARGTGLGLAICKMIVEEHDGKIGVVSHLGQGSEFWFSIPLPQTAD